MFIFYFLIFLFIIPESFQTDCEFIFPNRPRDCALSSNDKQNYKYCCYDNSYGIESCNTYNEEDYQRTKTQFENANPPVTFICNDETVDNVSDKTWKGCEDITPKKASDCVLSQEDKDHEYDYCCYEEIGSIKVCTLDTEESYKEEMEMIQELGIEEETVYRCDGKGSFLNISFMFIILSILNI